MDVILSVVTITYNHEAYISKCIEGVLAQKTNFPIEYIIAEDCSTDSTRTICEEYARKDPNIITLITSSENVGVLANERRAIESAQGKYIALCEGDDYWTDPLKLQKQVDFLETHPDYSVCFHNRMIESKEGISFKDEFRHFCSPSEPGFELTLDILYNHWVTFPFTMVFRRDAFDVNWYNKYKLFRDSHMIFHFLQRGRAYVFSFVGGVRTIHNDSMYHVMDSLQCAKTDMLVYQELFSANKSAPQGKELKNAYSKRIQCYINMATKDKKERLDCVLLSFLLLFLNHSLKCFGKNIFALKNEMKTIGHYLFWLKRDFARWIVRNSKLSIFLAKYCLKTFLSFFYFDWTGIKINWEEPEDFNQWLLKTSLKSRRSKNKEIIAKCADKNAVRDYISSMGYSDTLVELIGVYDNVDDIDFESLPDSFAMKMNNASGRNLICRDKSTIDWDIVKGTFRDWLNDKSFGLKSGEWQYSLIEPKIVIEKYLESIDEASIIDYKFNVINGHVYSCFVGYNRNPKDPHGDVCFDDYDMDWNRTEAIKEEWHKKRRFIPKPKHYIQMVEMAERLCQDLAFCRFDVYEVTDKLYFGEMTFTPQGCILEFYNDWYLKQALDFANKTSCNV